MTNCNCTPAAEFSSTGADLELASRTALYQKIGSAELSARIANRRIAEVENSPAATMGGRELIRELAAATTARDLFREELITVREELNELDLAAATTYSDLAAQTQKLAAAALALNLPRDSTPNDLARHANLLGGDRDRLAEELDLSVGELEISVDNSEDLEIDLREIGADRDRLAGELAAAELRAQRLYVATAGDRDHFRDQLAASVAEFEDLEIDAREYATDRDRLAGELADLRAENLELRDQIAGGAGSADHTVRAELAAENSKLLKLGASYADRYDRLEIDRDRVAGSLAARDEEIADLRAENSELRDQISGSSGYAAALEIAELRAENSELGERLGSICDLAARR